MKRWKYWCIYLLIGSSLYAGDPLLIFPIEGPSRQHIQVGLLYNSQRITLGPELPVALNNAVKPTSFFLVQNILPPGINSYLDSLAFAIEIYALSNNAPTVASEISLGYRWPDFSFHIGLGGISSLETNAWRSRCAGSYTLCDFRFTGAIEISAILDIPEDWIAFCVAGATHYSMYDGLLSVGVEGRIAATDRWEAGAIASLYLAPVSLSAGYLWQRLPSGTCAKFVGGLSVQL